MNDALMDIPDPFHITTPDEDEELRALASALQLAQGFKLIFARCNQPDLRRRLVAELKTRLPELAEHIREIHFEEPIPHLLDALRVEIAEPPPSTVFVSGLEFSLPVAAEAHNTPFVLNLNAARNSFPVYVPCPLVLWVPEYVLTAISRGAPDFFSVRSGVYYFATPARETVALTQSLLQGDNWQVPDMPLEEKQERISAIRSLLQDYQSLPTKERDYQAEARLLKRLAKLHMSLGQWTEAEQEFQRVLTTERELGDHFEEAITLGTLGNIYSQQGRWTEALDYLQKSQEMFNKIGSMNEVGRISVSIGNVYLRQGKWREAQNHYEQGLALVQQFGDPLDETYIITSMGIIHQNQQQWDKSEECYQKSLVISRQYGNFGGVSANLNNLGELYGLQGRWTEAETAFQESLAIERDLGDYVGEGETLCNFALLRAAQGKWGEGLALARSAVEVLEKTQAENVKANARQIVTDLEAQLRVEKEGESRK